MPRLVFRQHAIRRMFERSISVADIEQALAGGKRIEDYPDDTPYPSCLWLGRSGGRHLHIVFADNPVDDERIVITVYEPDPVRWGPDLATRKQS
jgi:hypothetical protein